jgi:hypothetical protein
MPNICSMVQSSSIEQKLRLGGTLHFSREAGTNNKPQQ